MKQQVGVFLNGTFRYAKYNVGDHVRCFDGAIHEVEEIRVYPFTEYVFAYWLAPDLGSDVPEDELEEVENAEED